MREIERETGMNYLDQYDSTHVTKHFFATRERERARERTREREGERERERAGESERESEREAEREMERKRDGEIWRERRLSAEGVGPPCLSHGAASSTRQASWVP